MIISFLAKLTQLSIFTRSLNRVPESFGRPGSGGSNFVIRLTLQKSEISAKNKTAAHSGETLICMRVGSGQTVELSAGGLFIFRSTFIRVYKTYFS